MGLLDEAIKDHLELKRRHGADPGEVARLEHEALGPARREPVAPADPLSDEPHPDERALAEPPPAEPALADEDLDYDDEVPAEERLEAPIRHLEPPMARERELEAAPEPPTAREPELEDEPEPEEPELDPEPEAAAPPESTVDQPTRQFSLEELKDASQPPPRAAPEPEAPEEDDAPEHHADVVPADEEPEGDDVLEETPEFLQETPEHDRLWFEQKPPKDFDF